MGGLIADYEIQLVEPGCVPGAGRWGALVTLGQDISEVFPYLNAVLPDAQYDHENRVLIWSEQGQQYASRPREIRVAHVEDLAQAESIAGALVEKINKVFRERATITPRFTGRKLASVLDIFKLLPKTSCRQCGYITCMAYAADLRKGAAQLDWCKPLSQAEHRQNREKIARLISGD